MYQLDPSIDDCLDILLQTILIKQLKGMENESQMFHILELTMQSINPKIRQMTVIFEKSLVEQVKIDLRECWLKFSKSLKEKEDVIEKLKERLKKLEKVNISYESNQLQIRNQSKFDAQLSFVPAGNITKLINHSAILNELSIVNLSGSNNVSNVQRSLSDGNDKLLPQPNHNNHSMQLMNTSQERKNQSTSLAAYFKRDEDLSGMDQQKISLTEQQRKLQIEQNQSGFLVNSSGGKVIDSSESLSDRNSQSLLQQDMGEKKNRSDHNQKKKTILSHLNGNDLSNKKSEIHNQIKSNPNNQQKKTEIKSETHPEVKIQEEISQKPQQKIEKNQEPSQVGEIDSDNNPNVATNIGQVNPFLHSGIDQLNNYENILIVSIEAYSDIIEGSRLSQRRNAIISQQKSVQKVDIAQLNMIMQMQDEELSTIDSTTKPNKQQQFRKNQIFAMLRQWPFIYKWITKLLQKIYKIDLTYFDDKKGQYGNLNQQLNCFLQQYLKNQHLLQQFFQVKRITLTKKVLLSQRIKLMNINWTNLQQLVIYDDNNWCGWLQDFSFLNPVFKNNGYNLKIVEFHLDFLFPQYIEFLTQFSFTFKVEIYIKHMTQQTYLMLKKTKFINPDKIDVIFKLNKLQIEHLMRQENDNEQQNFNIQLLQSIDLQNVQYCYSLMQLDMKTFYDKCDCIKREYLSSLQLAQNLVEIWDVQIQNISLQDRLKQIYKLNQNDLFELQILRKMKSQLIFIKFEWKEVYKITLSNVISQDNEWPLFYQNSHNFSNLITIQFDFPYAQIQLVESEHLKKFKQLQYLIIAQGTNNKQNNSKDQIEERQMPEIKKISRLKSFYELCLKLDNIRVIFQPKKFSSHKQIHLVKELVVLLFNSSQQIENFQRWIRESLSVTLEYKTNESQLIKKQVPSHIINSQWTLEQKLANAVEILTTSFLKNN